MLRLSKATILRHSPLLFIPVLATLTYKLQNYFYSKGVINVIWISRKKNEEKDKLLAKISSASKYTICQSYKFGTQLRKINSKIIADFKAPNIRGFSLRRLHEVSWTLILAEHVTPETKKSFGRFIPQNFPEKKVIIIPYHDRLDVICDFVFQTAKKLAKKGNIIFFIPFNNPRWIFSFFKRKSDFPEFEKRFRNFENIFIYQTVRLFPLRLHKLLLFRSMDNYIVYYLTSFFIRKFFKPFVWCFDYKDNLLVKLTKKFSQTLYDCVDYVTSSNQKKAQEIDRREKELINAVDYFFVNSHSLRQAKSKIRIPNSVLPQGFDLDSFEIKSPLSKNTIKNIQTYKILFENIQKPIVGYVGSLSFRLDYQLLEKTIQSLPTVSFVFTYSLEHSPEDKIFGNPKANVNILQKYPNFVLIPKTSERTVVKEIIRSFQIGMIPYKTSLDFNRYSYPMKLYEYFYMGIPVVSTPIEELSRFPKLVKIGNTPKEWEKHITNILSKPWPKSYIKRQTKLAEMNSWENKIDRIISLLD